MILTQTQSRNSSGGFNLSNIALLLLGAFVAMLVVIVLTRLFVTATPAATMPDWLNDAATEKTIAFSNVSFEESGAIKNEGDGKDTPITWIRWETIRKAGEIMCKVTGGDWTLDKGETKNIDKQFKGPCSFLKVGKTVIVGLIALGEQIAKAKGDLNLPVATIMQMQRFLESANKLAASLIGR